MLVFVVKWELSTPGLSDRALAVVPSMSVSSLARGGEKEGAQSLAQLDKMSHKIHNGTALDEGLGNGSGYCDAVPCACSSAKFVEDYETVVVDVPPAILTPCDCIVFSGLHRLLLCILTLG